jgi:hypothetical protein
MEAIAHPNATHILGPPEGMEDRVYPLQVQQIKDGDDMCCVSRWQPSAYEIAKLAGGGVVELWVIGHGQPPVALKVVGGLPAEPLDGGKDRPRSDDGYWLYEFQKLVTNLRGWITRGHSETAVREIDALWGRWRQVDP